MKKLISLVLTVCLLTALIGCSASSKAYEAAQSLMASGDYIGAEAAFKQLGDYKDAADKEKECHYMVAKALMANGEYASAINDLSELGEYQDAADLITECRYLIAEQLMAEGKPEEAAAAYGELTGYKDADQKKADCENEQKYLQATAQYEAGKAAQGADGLLAALPLFREIEAYKDSAALMKECRSLAISRLLDSVSPSFQDCITATELLKEESETTPERLRSLQRLTLLAYVRENGIDETDSEGAACKKLPLLDKNTAGGTDIVTEEKLSLFAYEEQKLGMLREQVYSSGGVTYSENLRLLFDISKPEQADVLASSYTDLGVYSAYIQETYKAVANPENLKSKADIAGTEYVKQARQISGKNTQTSDYKEQISIEKILNSVPEFMSDFDAAFAALPFSVSLQTLGIGISDAAPVHEEVPEAPEPAAEETVEEEPVKEYLPTENERLEEEQDVTVICASGVPIYRGPDNTYEIIYTAALGDILRASAVSSGWAYVQFSEIGYGWADITQLFGNWMFEKDVNPALAGITAPKKYAAAPTVISTTDKANARSGPDTKASLLSSYITGTQGVLVGTTDAWYLVYFDGSFGWVHKNNFK